MVKRETDTGLPTRRPARPAKEIDRFQREQPPRPIPPRVVTAPLAGLLARALLGDRVVK